MIVEPWMQDEYALHDGYCLSCQRHFKTINNWVAHVSRVHPGVWLRLNPAWSA